MGKTSGAIDLYTLWACEGNAIIARWSYALDTSDDDGYPFVSEGQLMLRGDGVVRQRVLHSSTDKFSPWQAAPRAPDHDGPYTVADVVRMFGAQKGNYQITRLAEPPTPPSRPDLRRQLEKRLELMSAVCRELGREDADGDLASTGSQAAYGVLIGWMRTTYGSADDFRYALRDPAVRHVAPDLVAQLRLAAEVCDDLSMVYSAGCGMEFDRDMANLGQSVQFYLSQFG